MRHELVKKTNCKLEAIEHTSSTNTYKFCKSQLCAIWTRQTPDILRSIQSPRLNIQSKSKCRDYKITSTARSFFLRAQILKSGKIKNGALITQEVKNKILGSSQLKRNLSTTYCHNLLYAAFCEPGLQANISFLQLQKYWLQISSCTRLWQTPCSTVYLLQVMEWSGSKNSFFLLKHLL